MIDFFIKVKQHQELNLPFVIYKKPNKNKAIGFFQANDQLFFTENLNEKGFVFAPFDGNQIILMPKTACVKWETKITIRKQMVDFDFQNNAPDKIAQAKFEALVAKAIAAIDQGSFNKVVISREEIVALGHFDCEIIFKKLLKNYPAAFCYCWYHPKIGLWMGATPERLLKVNNNKFHTMALAGTKAGEDAQNTVWNAKEIVEQQIVTDFILENLKETATNVSFSEPYTLVAGKLLHILTDIRGVLKPKSNLSAIVKVLHPTPAVCGLPKAVAKDFILKNEGYNRAYYTGFLGELNFDSFNKKSIKSDLYVNLRCMQLKNNQAHIYIGCGITKQSTPQKEWEESVNKSMTMKRVL